MSRIGKMPIPVPPGVEVIMKGSDVTVKGPKGELTRSFNPDMSISLDDGVLTVSRPSDNRVHRSLHGLTRSLLANMVEGVSSGIEKGLDIVGVGYRARKEGDKVVLQVGHSHPVEVVPPPGITLEVVGTTQVKVRGIDKELVGDVAARIRAVRPPDRYKGKGIRYTGEQVRLKPGKAGKVGAKKR
ncbi:MAG: 50S ribosomal protein L6 [Chloroflexota bacterium]|nr:50S ribosomal protein L6 [Chloroflexota bacterium]